MFRLDEASNTDECKRYQFETVFFNHVNNVSCIPDTLINKDNNRRIDLERSDEFCFPL